MTDDAFDEAHRTAGPNLDSYSLACEKSANAFAKSLGFIEGYTEIDGKAYKEIKRMMEELTALDLKITDSKDYPKMKNNLKRMMSGLPSLASIDPKRK